MHVCARVHIHSNVLCGVTPLRPPPTSNGCQVRTAKILPKLESIPSLRFINRQGCICSYPYLRELESDTLDAVGLCAL